MSRGNPDRAGRSWKRIASNKEAFWYNLELKINELQAQPSQTPQTNLSNRERPCPQQMKWAIIIINTFTMFASELAKLR